MSCTELRPLSLFCSELHAAGRTQGMFFCVSGHEWVLLFTLRLIKASETAGNSPLGLDGAALQTAQTPVEGWSCTSMFGAGWDPGSHPQFSASLSDILRRWGGGEGDLLSTGVWVSHPRLGTTRVVSTLWWMWSSQFPPALHPHPCCASRSACLQKCPCGRALRPVTAVTLQSPAQQQGCCF